MRLPRHFNVKIKNNNVKICVRKPREDEFNLFNNYDAWTLNSRIIICPEDIQQLLTSCLPDLVIISDAGSFYMLKILFRIVDDECCCFRYKYYRMHWSLFDYFVSKNQEMVNSKFLNWQSYGF